MLKLTKGILLDTLRDFEAVFWPLVFPVILFFILVSVFGGMGTSNPVRFKLGILQRTQLTGFGKILENVIEQIHPEPFHVVKYEDPSRALKHLQSDKIQLLLEIPDTFNMDLTRAILTSGRSNVSLKVHCLAGKMESETAATILQTILSTLNIEIFKRARPGNFTEVNFQLNTVGKPNAHSFHYATYLFPGILLMAIMSFGFFHLPLWLVFNRTSGLNKRLYASPRHACRELAFAWTCAVDRHVDFMPSHLHFWIFRLQREQFHFQLELHFHAAVFDTRFSVYRAVTRLLLPETRFGGGERSGSLSDHDVRRRSVFSGPQIQRSILFEVLRLGSSVDAPGGASPQYARSLGLQLANLADVVDTKPLVDRFRRTVFDQVQVGDGL